jgi:hypothetical protein
MSNESSMLDSASSQSEPEDKQAGVFLFKGLQIFDRTLNWLTGLFHLTEKEQQQAGIDLSNQGR